MSLMLSFPLNRSSDPCEQLFIFYQRQENNYLLLSHLWLIHQSTLAGYRPLLIFLIFAQLFGHFRMEKKLLFFLNFKTKVFFSPWKVLGFVYALGEDSECERARTCSRMSANDERWRWFGLRKERRMKAEKRVVSQDQWVVSFHPSVRDTNGDPMLGRLPHTIKAAQSRGRQRNLSVVLCVHFFIVCLAVTDAPRRDLQPRVPQRDPFLSFFFFCCQSEWV